MPGGAPVQVRPQQGQPSAYRDGSCSSPEFLVPREAILSVVGKDSAVPDATRAARGDGPYRSGENGSADTRLQAGPLRQAKLRPQPWLLPSWGGIAIVGV